MLLCVEHPRAAAEIHPPWPESMAEVIIPARTAQTLAVGVAIAAFAPSPGFFTLLYMRIRLRTGKSR
jgi:hypothetical protein